MAVTTARRLGSVTANPPPGPRRIFATPVCSTIRTASRRTARLTPNRSTSSDSDHSTDPTGQPRAATSSSIRRATTLASFGAVTVVTSRGPKDSIVSALRRVLRAGKSKGPYECTVHAWQYDHHDYGKYVV